MSNAAVTTTGATEVKREEVKIGQSFAEVFTFDRLGFLFAVMCLDMMDGVNGAAFTTLRQYFNGAFSATADQVTWAGICYYAGKLYMLLLAAKLQNRFGQRRTFATMSIVLVIATAAAAFVPSYPLFVLVLLVQGCAGGAVLALGQGTLLHIFPRREQPLVQGMYALASVMFPATTVPVFLGEWAYHLDWRFAYLAMVPVGLLGHLWLLWKRKFLSNSCSPLVFMPGRMVLVITAIFSIVYVLQQGERNRWLEYPPIVWALLLALACVTGVAFIETRGGETFLPYKAFEYGNFTFGASMVLLAGVALFGSGNIISGFAVNVLSYPVSTSGLVQLSGTAFSTFAFLTVGFLIRFTKIPPPIFLLTGLLMFATSMWNLGDAPSNLDFDGFASWLIVRGFALGCQFIPLTLLTLTTLPAKEDVAAAGIFNFNRQIGALVGIAWLQTLVEHKTDLNQTIFGNVVSATSPNTMNYLQSVQHSLSLLGEQPTQIPGSSTAIMLQEAHRQWVSIAYNGAFESLALVFFFAFPFVVVHRIWTARYLKPPVKQ